MIPSEASKARSDGEQKPAVPSISLPKGGGAFRGTGEKFAANPVTGTGSMSVPIATSPGRSGFGPQLSLSYDSGSGNGPFGFGWSLSLPSITRKTDKGLPRYQDAQESDVYLLSGAEDLVPVLDADGTRFYDDTNLPGFVIHRYRPRIEGLFARIERWTKISTGEIHWRSITRDNVTTVYGKDDNSRIFAPADPSPTNPARIFSWLICESYDDKGNAIVYEYGEENEEGVDLGQANERNRVRTANRYLKRIKYGNRVSRLIQPNLSEASWMFEVVFDYDESHYEEVDPNPPPIRHRFVQASASAGQPWKVRPDSFSSHRAGFEVRTYRRCLRVLMFHHIPDLPTGEKGCDGLVRSTVFDYADLNYNQPVTIQDELSHRGSTRFASFIRSITQSGYMRDETKPVAVRNGVSYATYLKKSLPPLEFEYSRATIHDQVQEVDAASIENLPMGLDGSMYQWVDLYGEGISGILTEQAGAWYYKRNISPISKRPVEFALLQRVASKPNLSTASGQAQFMDLAGDGQPDLVVLDGPMPGLYEHDDEEGWQSFRPFTSRLNRDFRDPNLKFVDIDGDGHADVLITEDEAFVWHASFEEEGFGPAQRVAQALDEEKGPRVVFADGTQSIYLADMCGDGLTDLVRIRNGEVCYWPNQGYGRFGAKVTMDNAAWFDNPEQFDQRRIRLADIDGSGANDVIYLHRDGLRIYFNQSGNRLSEARCLLQFPHIDNLSSVMTADLLGNGTACLVWSSPLPGAAGRQMRYIDLMGGTKPHLLIKSMNNLGAETEVHYAPSTYFYLKDKRDGRPWVTRLPFPVHVVERIVTHDRISGNRFVTRYAYHHGFFDGVEREFRGFGMVEQWDTEEFEALATDGQPPDVTNIDASSHVPPVLTKTWFHTGVYDEVEEVSQHFAAEYYDAPKKSDPNYGAVFDTYFRALLPDTVIPANLTAEEEREACRALKGMMLRQEVYALDATNTSSPEEKERAATPYTVVEQNFTLKRLQPRGDNRHAVFFAHPREAVTCHYERNSADPRIQHALTLEVDDYGNAMKEVAVGYGRRRFTRVLNAGLNQYEEKTNPALADLKDSDQNKQTQMLVTFTENRVTNAINAADHHRTPLPCETRTWELTGVKPANGAARFGFDEWTRNAFALFAAAARISYEQEADHVTPQKRLIEHMRTLYRRDTLTGPRKGLLPLGKLESLALPGESYKLAFTPGLLTRVFQRNGAALLPNPADVLGGQGADCGGYVDLDADSHWWIPSGRSFFTASHADNAAIELAQARQHFFLPRRYRDPFGQDAFVDFDTHDLLMAETRDALGNTVAARNDYRVLQPWEVADPNGNRTQAAFDALGLVAGTAVMGRASGPAEGDSLSGFVVDLTPAEIDVFFGQPRRPLPDGSGSEAAPIVHDLLGKATTRIVYDLDCYRRTGEPPFAATIARETHVSDLADGQQSKLQVSFSYSDGFGREVQKKIQAEPGPVEKGGPKVNPRWVGSGWTIFNNKGKPVRQYEPFFDDTHRFRFGKKVGVSPILFYDPVERVVATLHPNHTYEKIVFDPWKQTTWDVNDTVLMNPKDDGDVQGFFVNADGSPRLPEAEYLPTGHALRTDAAHAVEFAGKYPDAKARIAEADAATKAAAHADTPTVVHLDALGRPFLSLADNGAEGKYETRTVLDIEGNEREVLDAKGRVVMRYAYDMLGNRIHQFSMEAGARWMLSDVAGKPIRTWDSRGHAFRTTYDALRRPLASFVTGADEGNPGRELRVGQIIYGDTTATGLTDAQRTEANLRGRPFRHFDQAGMVTSHRFDFKGNAKSGSRRLAVNYKTAVDYGTLGPFVDIEPVTAFNSAGFTTAVDGLIEAESFPTNTAYDALNRPLTVTSPDGSVYLPTFNEANLLDKVDVRLRGAAAATPFVTNIDYDAKGQRERIAYDNGAVTTYDHDPLTFRLVRLRTRRNGAGSQVQNLHYAYDPVGNITHIRDDAQQTVFFRNRRVEPSADYIYDALYRLIQATGREHLGQLANGERKPPTVPDGFNTFHTRLDHPGDGNAMGTYIERYVYDAVGNFLRMQHRGSDPSHPGWTRRYFYEEGSLLEPGKKSNRLSHTKVGNRAPERYVHDAHGNMTFMPHLGGAHPGPNMLWDYRDQLLATARQIVNNGGTPETTYYVYDAAGQRVRKVTERYAPAGEAPKRKQERIYLGGFEIYREYENDGATPKLERETLHVMDDKQRIALVEMRTLDTAGNDQAPERLIRYQFGNHLGSASLELDEQAQIISYEEYAPYGSTTYQAVWSQTETAKRYRYTGKERDEENGLYYYGARYLSVWLGRWTNCDPIGVIDSNNLFELLRGSPLNFVDREGCASRKINNDIIPTILHEVDLIYSESLLNVQAQFHNISTQLEGELAEEVTQDRVVSYKEVPGDWESQKELGERGKNKTVVDLYEKGGLSVELKRSKSAASGSKKRKQERRQKQHAMERGGAYGRVMGDADPVFESYDPNGKERTPVREARAVAPVDPATGKALESVPKPDTKVPVPVPSSGKKGLSSVIEIVAKRGAKFAPLGGDVMGAAGVADELSQGNFRRATLETIGMSPTPFAPMADAVLFVEDVGWGMKEVLDPEQKFEQWFYEKFL